MKKLLILKSYHDKIKVFSTHIEIVQNNKEFIMSFRHIKAVYINKSIEISLEDCYRIYEKVPLYIIDSNGYIVCRFAKNE